MAKTRIVRDSLQMKTDRRRRDGWQRARLTVPPTGGGADERGPERKGGEAAKGMRARVRVERLRWGRRPRRAGVRAESGIGARRRPDERPKKVGQIR